MSSASGPGWFRLPEELQLEVVDNLNLADIKRLMGTCKTIRDLIDNYRPRTAAELLNRNMRKTLELCETLNGRAGSGLRQEIERYTSSCGNSRFTKLRRKQLQQLVLRENLPAACAERVLQRRMIDTFDLVCTTCIRQCYLEDLPFNMIGQKPGVGARDRQGKRMFIHSSEIPDVIECASCQLEKMAPGQWLRIGWEGADYVANCAACKSLAKLDSPTSSWDVGPTWNHLRERKGVCLKCYNQDPQRDLIVIHHEKATRLHKALALYIDHLENQSESADAIPMSSELRASFLSGVLHDGLLS